ncbi:hypothetical protein J8L85_09935 [Maribacter sp. MMG018]|uniref:hypothetical protein n=1 Tax=Maribacter sp. MMG018 TaxID=2822688 RepID=UPI001B36684C|nr:hypothetical protein [Maribacter sp. MMG018]MBQ4914755.1 hypothetical protein [Maribacter sp. MMG018]
MAPTKEREKESIKTYDKRLHYSIGINSYSNIGMRYDIVTKGHGGELQVETEESEGTTFIINLKIND